MEHWNILRSRQRGFAVVAFMAAVAFSRPTSAQNLYQQGTVSNGNLVFNASIFLCVLNGVKGNFSNNQFDGGNWIGMEGAQNWALGAGDHGRVGTYTCTNWSNFLAPAQGQISFSGPSQNDLHFSLAPADVDISRALSDGRSAAMLARMEGEFEGGGERMTITQSTTVNGLSKFALHSEAGSVFSPTSMHGKAMTVFVGNPLQNTLVRLIGYNTNNQKVRGDAATAGTFVFNVSTESGASTFLMANVPKVGASNPGICYFTKLSGDFNGTGEYTTITDSNGVWKLSAVAGGGKVYSQARCMALDQR